MLPFIFTFMLARDILFCRCIHLLCIRWLTMIICLLMIMTMNITPFLVHWEVVRFPCFVSLFSFFFYILSFYPFLSCFVYSSILYVWLSLEWSDSRTIYVHLRDSSTHLLLLLSSSYRLLSGGEHFFYIIVGCSIAIFIPKEKYSCWLVWARTVRSNCVIFFPSLFM